MPSFVPVQDPEKARHEQDETALAKHRNFDSMVVARQRTETTNRGWEQGAVGWGVLGSWGSSSRDQGAQVTRKVADPRNKMVKNEKGLWVKVRDLEAKGATAAVDADVARDDVHRGTTKRPRNDDERQLRDDRDRRDDDDDDRSRSRRKHRDSERDRRSRVDRRDRVRRDEDDDRSRRRRDEDDGRRRRRRDDDEYRDRRGRDEVTDRSRRRRDEDGGRRDGRHRGDDDPRRERSRRAREEDDYGRQSSTGKSEAPETETAPADFAFSCSQLVDRVLEIFNSDAPPADRAAALSSCFAQDLVVAPLRQGERPPAMSGARAVDAVASAAGRGEADVKLRIYMEPGGGEPAPDETTFCLDVYPADQAPGLSAVIKGVPADTVVLWRARHNHITHAYVAPDRDGLSAHWEAVTEATLLESRIFVAGNELLTADLPASRNFWEFHFHNYTTDIQIVGV